MRVIDMHSARGAALAAGYGVARVPAVVVAGRLDEDGGPDDDPREKGREE
ncbi:MAG TPA: hypothetical protein VF064_14140 [Pyrinomonadaceae bacterium]